MADASIRAVITAEDRASRTLQGFSRSLDGIQRMAMNVAKRLVQAGIAATGVGVVLGVKTAAQLESARMGFITLLGSADAADKTIARIKTEAARTPFEIAGLTQATQMLTAVTKDGDRALDFILDIGEGLSAMGRGQAELDRIAVNIQQIAATGRAFGIDIRQFAFAGIPIYEMLQEEIGLTGEALQKFIEEGGVTFELLERMFATSTEQGGRFFGAFKNQLGTFSQQWSNLKDTLSITAATIVTEIGLFDALKNAMGGIGAWIVANKGAIIGFFNFLGVVGSGLVNMLRRAWEFLRQPVMAFWAIVRNNLIPELQRLWHGVLRPLAPVLGVLIVGALRITIRFVSLLVFGLQVLIRVFNNVVQWGKNVGGAVVGAFRSIRSAYDRYIAPIANAIGKVFSFLTAPIRGVGKLLGGLFKAEGGPIRAGHPYIVGEQGPEMVIPNQSGTVIPNHKLGATGSSSTINLNVNIGMFAGSAMERRKIAETLMRDLKDVASMQGTTVTKLLAT